MREEEAHWKPGELKSAVPAVLAALGGEKVLLREGLEAAAAVEPVELTMARVTEALLKAEEVVVLRAVPERTLLEAAAAEEVPQREPVLRTLVVAEELKELKELGQPKLELAEEELATAWLGRAFEKSVAAAVFCQLEAAVPLASSGPLLRLGEE